MALGSLIAGRLIRLRAGLPTLPGAAFLASLAGGGPIHYRKARTFPGDKEETNSMSVRNYDHAEATLLDEILVGLGAPASNLGPQPWKIQIWDDADQVLCDGFLKDVPNQTVLYDDSACSARNLGRINNPAPPPMFRAPYRAELTVSGYKLCGRYHANGNQFPY